MKINYDSIIDEEKLFNQNQIDGSVPVRPPVDELNIFKHTLEVINKSHFLNNYIMGHVWENKLNSCYNVCGKGIQKEIVVL